MTYRAAGVDETYRAAGVDVAVVEQRRRGSFELGHTATEPGRVHGLLLVPLDRLTPQAETRSSRLQIRQQWLEDATLKTGL